MKILQMMSQQVEEFLLLAESENWVVGRWEPEFLLTMFPQGCFCAKAENGSTVGFITSIKHTESGWIGNLIVNQSERGKGVGGTLFTATLNGLLESGVETVWLTASDMGRSIYEKQGFTAVDVIQRWVSVAEKTDLIPEEQFIAGISDALSEVDSEIWGDKRSLLLDEIRFRCKTVSQNDGFMNLQPYKKYLQMGPFEATSPEAAEEILQRGLSIAPKGSRVCIDAPVSNKNALKLFTDKGFKVSGTNTLMLYGKKPSTRFEYLYGLATMGSCG